MKAKQAIVLGALAVGGFFGYRWWRNRKAEPQATAPKSAPSGTAQTGGTFLGTSFVTDTAKSTFDPTKTYAATFVLPWGSEVA